MKKKVLCGFLAVAMTAAMVGCGSKADAPADDAAATTDDAAARLL